MRTLLIVLAVALICTFTGCSGGGTSVPSSAERGITGKYLNEDDSDEYLELKKDGTFFLREGGVASSGEWEIEGDTITIHVGESGLAGRGTIEDDRIVDEDGVVWVRGGDGGGDGNGGDAEEKATCAREDEVYGTYRYQTPFGVVSLEIREDGTWDDGGLMGPGVWEIDGDTITFWSDFPGRAGMEGTVEKCRIVDGPQADAVWVKD